jgi:hypothetical protein
MKHSFPHLLLCLAITIGIITAQGADDARATVLLKNPFDDASAPDVGWTGLDNFTTVNDKANGALDTNALTPGKNLLNLVGSLPNPVNPDSEKCVVRLSGRFRVVQRTEDDRTRMDLTFIRQDGDYYSITFNSEAACAFAVYHAGAANQKQVGRHYARLKQLTNDDKYHTYAIEIRPKAMVAILIDDEVLDEQDLSDPDSPNEPLVELTKVAVHFNDASQSGAGKNWFLDKITFSKELIKEEKAAAKKPAR